MALKKIAQEISESQLRWRLAELAKQFENLSDKEIASYREEMELLDRMSGDGLENE